MIQIHFVKLLLFKRNETPHGMLLLEINHLSGGISAIYALKANPEPCYFLYSSSVAILLDIYTDQP